MKRILLASASIVAFAGAAAAQDPDTADTQAISFGGSAELGFNDEQEDGFYYNADLTVGFLAELDNGLRARVDFTIPVSDNDLGDDSGGGIDDDFVLAIEAEGVGGLFFGDTAFAAETHWDPGIPLSNDGFSEQDNETTLRGDGSFAGFDFSVSTIIADDQNDQPGADGIDRDGDEDLDRDDARDIYTDQISIGASGELSLFTMNFAYQEDSDMAIAEDDAEIDGLYDTDNGDFNRNELLAIAAGTTFGGADVKFAFSRDLTDETDAYGVLVRYPFGPVSVSAAYVFEPDLADDSYSVTADYENGPLTLSAYYESVADGGDNADSDEDDFADDEVGVEATYALSDTTIIQAGYIEDTNEGNEDDDDQDEGVYAAYRQGLGANAYVQLSYAEWEDAGDPDLKEGTTIAVGFEF